MTIVKTESVPFDGGTYRMRIKVPKDGKFHIPTPQKVTDLLGGKGEVVADTLHEARKLFNELLAEYRDSQTTKNKVILYEIEYNDEENGLDEMTFTKGLGLSVAAGVYEEHVTKRRVGTKVFTYLPISSSLPKGMEADLKEYGVDKAEQRMPWTEEREAFFRELGLAMQALISKVESFSSTRQKLIKMASKGLRVLPALGSNV